VARSLAPALTGAGYRVVSVASRTQASAYAVAALVPGCKVGTLQQTGDAADLVLITTSDGAIADVVAQVRWRDGMSAVHCSGALTTDVLEVAKAQGSGVGSWHPFQTFSDVLSNVGTRSDVDGGRGNGSAASPLDGATVGIEAEGALLETLTVMAERLGAVPLPVPAEARVLYHAASVMSCGYLTTLLHQAELLWERAGLPREGAMPAIAHIVHTTVDKVAAGGAGAALSGPTSRGDAATVHLHLEAIASAAPEILPLYREIAKRSVSLAEEAGKPAGDIDWEGLLGRR
jgi:predicted short-subunit dehydrogenase-like oxidoreductase (DUF2520 family)